MGGALSNRARSCLHGVLALLLAVVLVLVPLSGPHPFAFADASDEAATEQAVFSETTDNEGDETIADEPVPEAGTNSSNPIKPRPKVEITTDVVAIEPISNASIDEESTPLGAFDLETCFFHPLMLVGIALTIGYALFAFYRIHRHTERLNKASSVLTDGIVCSAEVTPFSAGVTAAPQTAPADN